MRISFDQADGSWSYVGRDVLTIGTYEVPIWAKQDWLVPLDTARALFARFPGRKVMLELDGGHNDVGFRDESLNANDPVTKANQFRAGRPNKRPASRINQFGGRIGGPIVENRAFFFFSYDGQRSDIPQVLDVPNFSAAPAAAQAILLPKLNTYQVGRNQDVFLGKADISLNQSNQLTLRYNHQGFTGQNNENNGPLSAEEHSGDSVVKSDTFSGSLASTLSSKVLNEFRFQIARDKEPGEANIDAPEAVINTGSGNLWTADPTYECSRQRCQVPMHFPGRRCGASSFAGGISQT